MYNLVEAVASDNAPLIERLFFENSTPSERHGPLRLDERITFQKPPCTAFLETYSPGLRLTR
jgi:hypothetical protein